MPLVVESISGLQQAVARSKRVPVGFVPTMGALHAGHVRLIGRARAETRVVVVSVFVNPLQFDQPGDLNSYPRDLDRDVALCGTHGVDIVFAPAVSEMYPVPPLCAVDVGAMADHLCGKFRPGHFRAVATVVLKFFNIVRPDYAYFGEKDAQQLAIIRRLVRDFNVPLSIVGVETVREADGLALSSRNARLSPEEREIAPALHRALHTAADAIAGGASDSDEIRRRAAAVIPAHGSLRLEYLEIVDPDTMQPVETVVTDVCVAGAMWVGSTRLIDNVTARPPH
jgi:pantoate--beta-alanine ligase